MTSAMQILHLVAALVVLAEALNKLERATPFAAGMTPHARLVHALKALAWGLLALGAGCTLAAPLLAGTGFGSDYLPLFHNHTPSIDQTAVMVGFAVLIIRTRIKEG